MIQPADSVATARFPLTLAEQRALIALACVPGIGPGRCFTLVEHFGAPSAVFGEHSDALAAVEGIGRQTAAQIAGFDDGTEVDRQIERAVQVGAEMITRWDDRYPFLLGKIYDPPAFLWTRGEMPVSRESDRIVAVVGTRRPSEYGRRVAREFTLMLAELGFTIVSGLAYGIDAVAHAAALEAEGRTIAVLGSGVDRIYPARHAGLARRMIERGAVISEFEMGAAPDASNFPRRNRIVSGLAAGTLIVEAYEDGGALITARLAVEQNREVFAIPGPIHSKASAGANRLIKNGEAKLVQRLEDVIEELGVTDAELVGSGTVQTDWVTGMSPEEIALCRALSTEPEHIDRICAAAGVDSATALVHLLNLEFKGVVRQLAGMQFFLTCALEMPPENSHPAKRSGAGAVGG